MVRDILESSLAFMTIAGFGLLVTIALFCTKQKLTKYLESHVNWFYQLYLVIFTCVQTHHSFIDCCVLPGSSDLDGRGAFTFDVLPGYAIPMLNECGVASVTSRKCVEHVSKNGIQPDLTQI
jgi:hypothetical protein